MVRARVRARKRVPYDEMIELMMEGHEVFIPDIGRRTAWYIKKKLSEKIGEEVVAYPSEYKGMSGYLFKVSLISKLLEMMRNSNKVQVE